MTGTQPAKPGDCLGDFRLEALVHQGSSGELFRATQLSLDRLVALTLLRPDVAEGTGFETRFTAQSQPIAALSHPHLLPFYAAGQADGRFFYVARWVDGPTLRSAMGSLSLALGLEYLTQVARALSHAHGRGVLHRRITSGRILLCDGNALLAGLSPGHRDANEADARFLAPEQLRKERATEQSDVWALGVILADLAGEHPPAALDKIIRQAVQSDPTRRYANAALFQQALEQWQVELALEPGGTTFGAAEQDRTVRFTDRLSQPPAGQRLNFGKYRILEALGHGGMGIVYRAEQPELRRHVALKVLHQDGSADRESIDRFRIEARAIARLRHANIVKIHEVGEVDGVQFFTMDLIEGGTLRAHVLEAGQTVAEALAMMEQLARAIGYAHQQGVIHRDLKPSNVLLGERGRPLITDFGLAKELNSGALELTGSGALMGTPAYMSPEQARGQSRQVDARCDIYSLGATLYFMLTGRPPQVGNDAMALIRAVAYDDPPPPSTVNPLVPVDAETICLKALAKEPGQRYQTAELMADDIQRFLAGEPLAARPPSAIYRLRRWVLRHKLATAAMLSLGLALGMLLSGVWWGRHRAAEAQLRAQQRQLGMLQQVLRSRRKISAPLLRLEPGSMREPNGQLIEPLVERFYRAQGETLSVLERIGRLRNAPAEVAGQRRQLCLDTSRTAVALGQVTQARIWIGRAGLAAGWEAAELARIDRLQHGRRARTLRRAGRVLAAAGQVDQLNRGFEFALAELVRMPDPAVVGLLLSRRYLESPVQAQRLLVIAALGRIGETRTVGEMGMDPVRALCACLDRTTIEDDFEVALALARALGLLRDKRGFASLERARERAGFESLFWQRTADSMARIPPPLVPLVRRTDVAALLRTAATLIARQEPDEAIVLLDQAIRREPKGARGYELRGLARFAKKQYPRAIANYSSAIQLDPSSAEAYGQRGVCYRLMKQLERAGEDLDRALQLDPGLTTAYGARARLRLETEDHAGALADIRALLLRRPRDATAYYLRSRVYALKAKPRDQLENLNRALQLNPRLRDALLERGMLRFAQREYRGALGDLSAAIDQLPHPHAFFIRAKLLVQLGDLSRAESDVSRAIRLRPNHAVYHHLRADILAEQGRYEPALADISRAEELGYRNQQLSYIRCKVMIETGQAKRAIPALGRLIKQGPATAAWYFSRGRARKLTDDAEGALADFGKALQLEPDHLRALLERGVLLSGLGRLRAGLPDLNRVVLLRPNAQNHFHRGMLRARLGDNAGAVQDYTAALRLRPGNWKYQLWRAMSLQQSHQFAAAIRDYAAVNRARPRYQPAHHYRAECHWSLGQPVAASTALEISLRLAPRYWYSWRLKARILSRAGRRAEAIQAFGRALRHAPAGERGALRVAIKKLQQK